MGVLVKLSTRAEKWLRAGRETRLRDDMRCTSPYHQKNERVLLPEQKAL
jgi:hypothetical protein